MSASAFTPTVLTISSGTGSGSGEKNYITNPSMASATTGWNVVGDFTLTRTTAASELPREYTTGTGIKLVATSGTQSTADYMYFDFNLDDVDLNRKLKIQWSQKDVGTYAAGQLAVIITSQADRTTALHTPVTTAIPAVDGDFVTSFDSGSTAALSLVIRATTDMTTGDGIVISDVIVGPGEIVQGAVVSEWQSYTPTITNVGTATFTTSSWKYKRVGSDIEINGYFLVNAAGSGSSNVTISLPSGLTINTSAINQGTGVDRGIYGYGQWKKSGSGFNLAGPIYINTTSFEVFFEDGSGVGTVLIGSNLGNTDELWITARLPISEWSGSGTVNLGPGAQVEYASNSTAWGTSNTTAFQYGSSGAAITGALSSEFQQRIQFQYPIQDDDILRLEFRNSSSDPWFPQEAYFQAVANSIAPYTGIIASGATDTHGATFYKVSGSNTQLDVVFGRYVDRQYSGTAMQAKVWANGMYWRVRKAKASSPVGFGKADSTSFGLVGPRRGQYALTFSSTPGGWSLKRGVGIYYQDQDGNHRLQMNIIFTATGATSFTFTVDGVTFKDLGGGFQQALAVMCVGSAPYTGSAGVSSNSGTVNVYATSSSTDVRISGDVELQSKPTWA